MFCMLRLTLGLFIRDRWRCDAITILVLLKIAIAGLIAPESIFRGSVIWLWSVAVGDLDGTAKRPLLSMFLVSRAFGS